MAANKTAKQSTAHVQAWRRSGLTQAEYCAKHGLNHHTLAYWSCRTLPAKERSSDTGTAARFVPLQVTDAKLVEKQMTLAPVALEVWWPNGMRARIAAGTDAVWVAAVLGGVQC